MAAKPESKILYVIEGEGFRGPFTRKLYLDTYKQWRFLKYQEYFIGDDGTEKYGKLKPITLDVFEKMLEHKDEILKFLRKKNAVARKRKTTKDEE